MRSKLDTYPNYRDKLYARGFLLTDAVVEETGYPYYGKWNRFDVADKHFLVHPLQHMTVETYADTTAALVGHAYHPFAMEHEESKILSTCLERLQESEQKFWDYFNGLTGVFTFFLFHDDEIWIVDDASGMQTTFYTAQNGKLYVSSHTMLVGELLGLKKDPYVERLAKYRFFPLLGNSLPGDLTQFVGLKRVTPNFCCVYQNGAFTNKRFFAPYQLKDKTRQQLVDEAGQILHNSLELIAKKWERPVISLTGGCDSKTTLACANGLYDRFRYYSYSSSEAEQVDCEAAATICKALGLEHKIYPIPETSSPEDHEEIVA